MLRGRLRSRHRDGRPGRVGRAAAGRRGRGRPHERRVDGRRQPDHQPGELPAGAGDSRRGERHSHRAEPQVFGRAVPRRRPDVRSAAAAARHAPGAGLAHQGHGQDGHRRAQPAAGRPVSSDGRRPRSRLPRLDAAHRAGREDRDAYSRQGEPHVQSRPAWAFRPTCSSSSSSCWPSRTG